MQTLGTTEISISYSRPGVKGRTIWGDPTPAMMARAKGEATLDDGRIRQKGEPIVPFGHIWRAGANEATLFTFTDDVIINGSPLPAGKYSFHTVPGKDEWTLIFNKDEGQWGSFAYDAAKDALRVKTKPETTADNQEFLSYSIEPVSESSARVNLRWERLRVPFTVEVKDVVGSTMTRLNAFIAGAKPGDPGPYMSGAVYAKSAGRTEDAMRWAGEAMKINDTMIAAKPTFQNLSRKAELLFLMDKKADAISAAEAAIAQGKTDGAATADIQRLERRVAEMKASK